MSKPISHLVWLGAGSAAEPANLFDKAEKITLIEARESACLQLQQKYNEPHFQIKQHLIGATESNLLFTEYNLAEFSAASQISGLKNLFPGIQKVREEKATSVAITDALKALELTGDNNTLIIDIPDLSIELLSVLEQQDQLHLFNNIQIASSLEPLYAGAITSAEISAFLSAAGYALQQTISNDPELPWLNFNRNPLWTTLQITQKELLASKQQLITQQQENEILNKALEESQINGTQKIQQLEQELKGAQIALINSQKITEETKSDLQKKLSVAQSELSASKQEITTLSQEREKFSKDLEKIRLESKQKIQQLEQQLSAAQQALITNQKATEQTQSETQKSIAAVKADAEKQVSVIKAVLETTKIELTKKQNENEELGKSLEAIKLNCDKKVQQMEQQLITQQRENELLNKALEESQINNTQKIQQLEEELKGAQIALNNSQKITEETKSDLQKKLAVVQAELSAKKHEVSTLTQEREKLSKDLEANNLIATQRAQELEKQLGSAQQELLAIKRNINKEQSESEKLIQTQEKQIAALQQELIAENSSNETIKAELAKLKILLKQKESEFARELDIEKSKVNEEKRETLKQKTRNDEINLALAEANEATQEAAQKLHAIQKELEKAKNEIVLKNQDKDIAFANLEKCKAEILALQKSDQDQKQLISKLQANLDQASKHASTRLEKINNLEKSNRLLQETNMQLQERQQALERELIKAQAQIELITDLL